MYLGEGHFDHNGVIEVKKETDAEPRLAKGLRMMGLNGAEFRTITSTRPNIDTPLTSAKKSVGQHKIDNVFGSKSYHYNDSLTAAYIVLCEKSALLKKSVFFITVTLNDDINLKLRRMNSDISKETMVRTASKWFRAFDYITDAIVVMEECSKSVVEHEKGVYRRLHLHIVTMLNDNELGKVQNGLFKDKRIQIQIQNTWTDKRLYSADDEWEEEEFGPIPVNAVDPDADYWLNTNVKENVDKSTGKVTKVVYREHPVCLRAVDYMSKTLQKPIGRGQNHTFIGLKERSERRRELSLLGRELLTK